MKEIWQDIKGYENLYQISNFGRVKSLKRNIIRKQGYDKDKYPKIELYNKNHKTFHIHTLVANAFISNQFNLPQINHIDGNKQNNCASNLEWCDASFNSQHRVYNLNKNSLHPCKKIKCVEINRVFPSISEAARNIGVKQSTLSEVISKPNRTCKGYHWTYIKE